MLLCGLTPAYFRPSRFLSCLIPMGILFLPACAHMDIRGTAMHLTVEYYFCVCVPVRKTFSCLIDTRVFLTVLSCFPLIISLHVGHTFLCTFWRCKCYFKLKYCPQYISSAELVKANIDFTSFAKLTSCIRNCWNVLNTDVVQRQEKMISLFSAVASFTLHETIHDHLVQNKPKMPATWIISMSSFSSYYRKEVFVLSCSLVC